jgi:hypothetical protein
MTLNLPSKEEARLCASIVKEVGRAQGIVSDPAAIGRLTVTVARLFNKGLRDRDELLTAATESVQIPADLPSAQ